jgi:hypothetical protein
MDRNDRPVHRRQVLNTLAARIAASICSAAAFVTGVSCARAAGPPQTQSRPAYADSSRAGVLEFLDVATDGRRGRVVIDRYVQDFSYCSGVVHRIDARAGELDGHVIALRGGGAVRLDGRLATVDEPGARGVHRFRGLSDPRAHARLIRAFFYREARLRKSLHYSAHVAVASTHCKK